MRPRFLLVACCLGAVSVSISSAFAQVGAPQLGWVPDGARIRPVYGIPAAAAVGAPVPADQDFSQIAASPARNYVLVSAADTGTVSIYTPEHGLVPLDGAGGAPDSVVLSPRGSSAALWFSVAQPGASGHRITGCARDPAGGRIRSGIRARRAGDLRRRSMGCRNVDLRRRYAFGPNGEVNRLPVESATALAFFQGTHNLAAAGPAGLQMVTGIESFAVVSNLLTSADSSLQPVAVAATSDNRTLVLADHSGSVTTIDIASGAATASDCGCQPAGLFGIGTLGVSSDGSGRRSL